MFVGVCLENAGMPVPGETALLAGAALSNYGRLSLPWVIANAIVAAILGDNVGFLIGRRFGRSVLERHGRRVGLTDARLAMFDRFFKQHGARTHATTWSSRNRPGWNCGAPTKPRGCGAWSRSTTICERPWSGR